MVQFRSIRLPFARQFLTPHRLLRHQTCLSTQRADGQLLEIGEMGKMLGRDFVEFTAADQAKSRCFISRIVWVSIVPHPQIAAVSQINFANRRPLAVAGSVKDVLARLERRPSARSARRASAR